MCRHPHINFPRNLRAPIPLPFLMFASSTTAAAPSTSAPSTSSVSANNNSNNNNEQGGIFWSPAPPQPMQPTSILQRPAPPPPQGPPPQSHLSQLTSAPAAQTSTVAGQGEFTAGDYSQIFEWVSQLLKGPEGREKALLELSRKREQYDDLALILWHSFGILLPLLLRLFLFEMGVCLRIFTDL
jgi:hypothetical protein